MGKEIDLLRKTITEDKNGNAWFQGNVSIDGTPTNDNDLITKKYVDDNKFSGDYNDLTNKPCYDNREYGTTTLTYDGNSEGKDVRFINQQNKVIKITDDISEYDVEGLKNSTVVLYNKEGSNESDVTEDITELDGFLDLGNVYVLANSIFVVPFEEAELDGISFTKGIWFGQAEMENEGYMMYVKSLTYNKYISGELKKIDKKYLPDDIGEQYVTQDQLNTSLNNLKLRQITQAEYDALENKDANTLYIIIE